MEWRRIVAKKQFLLGIVLLGLLGLVFFLQSIALDFRSEQEMFGVNFFQAVEARKETLRQLR